MCGYERDSLDSVESYDARVILCLQARYTHPSHPLDGQGIVGQPWRHGWHAALLVVHADAQLPM